jgi:hypothetical protein
MLNYVVSSIADGVAHSPERVVVSLGGVQIGGPSCKQAAVRGSVSMNFGGSRTTQVLSEHVLCIKVLFFRERKREKEIKEKPFSVDQHGSWQP